ncbi:MAG TPA: neutral zinc metallopeptidase [Candidatus Paceibacterota bacterium]|nr:neutral zinc metallopeptidase [Candidatus Paceibacterota bacterium]
MADWTRIGSRGQVLDRRAFGPTAIGGGLGITGIVLYLLLSYLGSGQININDVINSLEQVQVPTQSINTSQFEGADSYEVFASTVLGSANDMWRQVFSQQNFNYEEPTIVLFRGATPSSCGTADSRVGPHYCPLDGVIYIDETFFDELQKLGAQGDVAEAYVIAHEVGHHVQNQLGILSNEVSQDDAIRIELQADCFAGLWAYSIRHLGVFAPGEIAEAMNAAAAVGDDRIQSRYQGRVTPETWTHGSSEQRLDAFNRGYNSGQVSACM